MTNGAPGTERGTNDVGSSTAIVVRGRAGGDRELVQVHTPIIDVALAELSEPLDQRLLLLEDPVSAPARCYRLLRHRLLTADDPRVIAVTSALPGEGKTTCSVNLALSIAEDSLGSVLLLDANARRPALATVFGLSSLGGVYVGNAGRDPCYAVTAIGATGLHVASAVAGDASSLGRLDRVQFKELLSDLRIAYDYVVVDAASVLESADADVVSELSDGVVVTARGRASRRSSTSRALDQLHPAEILGIVLIDV